MKYYGAYSPTAGGYDVTVLPTTSAESTLGEGEETEAQAEKPSEGGPGRYLRYSLAGGAIGTGAGWAFMKERWMELGVIGLVGGIIAALVVGKK